MILMYDVYYFLKWVYPRVIFIKLRFHYLNSNSDHTISGWKISFKVWNKHSGWNAGYIRRTQVQIPGADIKLNTVAQDYNSSAPVWNERQTFGSILAG